LINVFCAHGLWRISRLRRIGKPLAILLFLGVTLTGWMDMFPLFHDERRDFPLDRDPIREWIERNTEPTDRILTNPAPFHSVLLAGRRLFLGFPQYAAAHGLDAEGRTRIVRDIYAAGDPETARSLLRRHGISYVMIDDWVRSDPTTENVNEELFDRHFEVVFRTDFFTYGRTKIYRVP
jgi:hypothetical protein